MPSSEAFRRACLERGTEPIIPKPDTPGATSPATTSDVSGDRRGIKRSDRPRDYSNFRTNCAVAYNNQCSASTVRPCPQALARPLSLTRTKD